MIRRLFRLIGAILLVIALVLLLRALYPLLLGEGFAPKALGQLWYEADPGSLNLTQAVVQRYIFPGLWDGAVWVLLRPAFAVAGVLGIILLLATWPRRRVNRGFR
jgi:hypothetical protein